MAGKAYRRPATDGEVTRLTRLVVPAMKEGDSFNAAFNGRCKPFWFRPTSYRWELDPARLPDGGVRELNDFEIASRLSYFLWSSMPDDQLFDLAGQGRLRQAATLETEGRLVCRGSQGAGVGEEFRRPMAANPES